MLKKTYVASKDGIKAIFSVHICPEFGITLNTIPLTNDPKRNAVPEKKSTTEGNIEIICTDRCCSNTQQ